MYRLHNYMRVGIGLRNVTCNLFLQSHKRCFSSFQGLQIQDVQQERLNLHRDIYAMAEQLGINVEDLRNFQIAEGVPLFPVSLYSKEYPGDTEILGK